MMKPGCLLLSVCAFIAIAGSSQAYGYTFTTLNYPGADLTSVSGVSGSTVVGAYFTSGISHGFIYDGSAFTTLDFPGVYHGQLYDDSLTGAWGGAVIGNYREMTDDNRLLSHGFMYTGSTFTPLDVPGALQTHAMGVCTGTVVGYYQDSNYASHGFTYNGSTFTPLNVPGATSTTPLGISGGTVTGSYDDSHAFTYDGSTFKTWDVPPVPAGGTSYITGVSDGGTVVGWYLSGPGFQYKGFVYDGSTFATVNYPGAFTTELTGISGNTAFGTGITYDIVNQNIVSYGPGFIVQIPEPASATLVAIVGLGPLGRRRKMWNRPEGGR